MTRAWTARVRHAGKQTILGFHLTSEAYRVTMALENSRARKFAPRVILVLKGQGSPGP